ncbi:MAG: efflux RND transporter periplasmic adaptor subunit [Alphaproteobacteria bacterium]
MSKKWSHGIIFVAAAGLAVGALILVFRPQPILVDLATVTQGPMAVTVADEGKTRIKEVYTVSAPISGRVLRIEAHIGDEVRQQHSILAVIRPSEPDFLDRRARARAEANIGAAEAAKVQATAAIAEAESDLRFAESDYERTASLAQRGNVSNARLEQAESTLASALAAVKRTRAVLQVSQFRLAEARATLLEPAANGTPSDKDCCVEVRAPIDGLVLSVMQRSAGVVERGQPLLEIGAPHNLEIVTDLLSTDAVKVAPGAAVEIDGWGGSELLHGIVRHVEPLAFTKTSALGIDEQRVNVIIDLTDPPNTWAQLGHGFRVTTRITVWQAEDILRLPLSALFRDGDQWAVFVYGKGDRAELSSVTVDHMNARTAELRDGLPAGTRVVLHPSERLTHGTRLAIRPPS